MVQRRRSILCLWPQRLAAPYRNGRLVGRSLELMVMATTGSSSGRGTETGGTTGSTASVLLRSLSPVAINHHRTTLAHPCMNGMSFLLGSTCGEVCPSCVTCFYNIADASGMLPWHPQPVCPVRLMCYQMYLATEDSDPGCPRHHLLVQKAGPGGRLR